MLAVVSLLIALICFVLVLFGVAVGVDLVVLGFCFVTAGLLFGALGK